MKAKYMNIKRITISTITLAMIASQLCGCSAVSKKELETMLNETESITIEIAEPATEETHEMLIKDKVAWTLEDYLKKLKEDGKYSEEELAEIEEDMRVYQDNGYGIEEAYKLAVEVAENRRNMEYAGEGDVTKVTGWEAEIVQSTTPSVEESTKEEIETSTEVETETEAELETEPVEESTEVAEVETSSSYVFDGVSYGSNEEVIEAVRNKWLTSGLTGEKVYTVDINGNTTDYVVVPGGAVYVGKEAYLEYLNNLYDEIAKEAGFSNGENFISDTRTAEEHNAEWEASGSSGIAAGMGLN